MGSHKARLHHPNSGGGRHVCTKNLSELRRNFDFPRANDRSDAKQPRCGRSDSGVAEERDPFDRRSKGGAQSCDLRAHLILR